MLLKINHLCPCVCAMDVSSFFTMIFYLSVWYGCQLVFYDDIFYLPVWYGCQLVLYDDIFTYRCVMDVNSFIRMIFLLTDVLWMSTRSWDDIFTYQCVMDGNSFLWMIYLLTDVLWMSTRSVGWYYILTDVLWMSTRSCGWYYLLTDVLWMSTRSLGWHIYLPMFYGWQLVLVDDIFTYRCIMDVNSFLWMIFCRKNTGTQLWVNIIYYFSWWHFKPMIILD